jgi:hypothetical protein
MGVYFGGPLLGPHPRNELGHWEHEGVKAIHRKLLLSLTGVEGWVVPRALPENWQNTAAYSTALEELVSLLERNRCPLFGVKDPVGTLFVSLWEQAIASLALKAHWILCLRDPREVYRSILSLEEVSIGSELVAYRRVLETWARYYCAGMTVRPLQVWFEDWTVSDEFQRKRIASWIGSESIGRDVYRKEMNHAAA